MRKPWTPWARPAADRRHPRGPAEVRRAGALDRELRTVLASATELPSHENRVAVAWGARVNKPRWAPGGENKRTWQRRSPLAMIVADCTRSRGDYSPARPAPYGKLHGSAGRGRQKISVPSYTQFTPAMPW